MRLSALLLIALAACNTASSDTDPSPPDAKAIVLAHKARLWKDPDSIKSASITAPRRHMGFMWHVCVRLNAKNSFGGYTGERDSILGMYDDGTPPNILMENAEATCAYPHTPFPELEGGFSRPSAPKPERN